MTTSAIIQEIDRLPLTDKLIVVKKTLEAIRNEKVQTLQFAANQLYNDYLEDKELIEFTLLDSEPFYETK
jgi:hypothetical protein